MKPLNQRIASALACLMMVISLSIVSFQTEAVKAEVNASNDAGNSVVVEDIFLPTEIIEEEETPTTDTVPTEPDSGISSLEYVRAMGDGWNLGNSFEAVNTALDQEDLGEITWGNPEVAKELIQAVKDKGYESIRMPLTLYRRFDEETFVVDNKWIERYKEVVNYAVEEGLYVMVDIHHDSWLWLSSWDGNPASEEYMKFVALWAQLAAYLADLPEQVCFETINEPTFEATGDITAQDKLDAINLAAYNAIRSSFGNNATRMIAIPTMASEYRDDYIDATVSFMESLNDDNLIATVHYYSEWLFSANLGTTGFDEILWDDYTSRDSADQFFAALNEKFIAKGIGVVVGEYGLLGYDSAPNVNQAGEELKYYEYMNYLANQSDVCLMLWDNGSGIDRISGAYNWKKPLVGEMLEISMSGRSAYVTELDRVFLSEEAIEDLRFPLTLNGHTFVGIDGLMEGTDYTYDEESATVTLSMDYVNAKYAEMGNGYGTFAELVFVFSSGADWYERLIKNTTAVMSENTGTIHDFKIPVEFYGSEVRRATAYMSSGTVGPYAGWCDYLQYGSAFMPDYENGIITILPGFWNDPSVVDGEITFCFEMYDGSVVEYILVKDGENITGYPAVEGEEEVTQEPATEDEEVVFEWASEMCVYVGENEFKKSYFNVPEGTYIYGMYTNPENATGYMTLMGQPGTITFGSTAQEESIKIGLMLTYRTEAAFANDITFWLKDAPTVDDVTLEVDETKSSIVRNLAQNARVTYEIEDEDIATVNRYGIVTGVEEGVTTIIVTVTQYGRTDSFEAEVYVTESEDESEDDSDFEDWEEDEEPEETEAPEETAAPTATPTATPTLKPTQAPDVSGEPAYTGFVTVEGINWWSTRSISKAELLGNVRASKVTAIKFSGDIDFFIGYNSTSGYKQTSGQDEYILTDVVFNSNYFLEIAVSANDNEIYEFTWEVYADSVQVPSVVPTAAPTAAPTATPTITPTATPDASSTAKPTVSPTATPTATPTVSPTAKPTATPTAKPTATPTAKPTATPTAKPTATPTAKPTATPTAAPTATPTAAPTATPEAPKPPAAPEPPAAPVPPAAPAGPGVASTGSVTIKGANWWAANTPGKATLLGNADPAKVTSIKFTCNTDFYVSYTSTSGFVQLSGKKEYTVTNMALDNSYYLQLALGKNDNVDYVISWQVYTN